jgi:hypothetical protein
MENLLGKALIAALGVILYNLNQHRTLTPVKKATSA